MYNFELVILQKKDEVQCTIQNVTTGFYCVLVSLL